MPSTISTSVSSALASSTVITPSLPTFCMACPIFLARFSMSLTTAVTAISMPRLRSIGFMPAATDLAPSFTIACANTVAVVVPSPALSLVFWATSRTIWAPMFSNLSSSSISLATVTPSLVMRGAPNDLSSTTLRPFGPSVTRTALARVSTPRSIRSRASVENLTSLAAIGIFSGTWSGDHAHDVGLFHDQQFVAVELHLGAGPLAEQNLVAGLDVDRDELAVFIATAGADSDNFALHWLFLGGVGNDDPASGLVLGFNTLDDHAVVQRAELELGHGFLLPL